MVDTYDTESLELAEYFLQDEGWYEAMPPQKQKEASAELAKVIQTAIEEWLETQGPKAPPA